jgi:hypothetical protein
MSTFDELKDAANKHLQTATGNLYTYISNAEILALMHALATAVNTAPAAPVEVPTESPPPYALAPEPEHTTPEPPVV